MAIIEIPVDPSIFSQKFDISLDGTLYTLRFFWNIRQQTWQLDILQSDSTPLVRGIKIVPDWMPVFRYKIIGFPPGDFMVVDTSGTGLAPERTEFGTDKRVKLLYREE